MKRIITFLFFSAATLIAANTFAQMPQVISYQGALLNASNEPVNGTHSLTLKLYDVTGTVVFEETQPSVQVTKSIFNVLIGSTIPGGIPASVQFDRQYFLGVAIDGGAELLPHTPLVSAPYALYAEVANGLAPGAKGVVTTLNTKSGAIRLVSTGGTTINAGGDSIVIGSSSGTGSITGLQSPDGTIGIVNPNGPTTSLSIASQSATTGQVLTWNGTKWVPGNSSSTVSATAPILGNGSSASPLRIPAAGGTTNGYLTSADWTTFNNKLSSVMGAAPITGNGTAGSPLSLSAANATTNGYLSSTDWTTFNNKLSTVSVRPPELAGAGTPSNPLQLAQQGATVGQVLSWNGANWFPATAGLTLPYSASANSAGALFSITNTGAGAALEGATSSAAAAGVEAQYTGGGNGIALKVTGGYMKVAGATKTAYQHLTAANNINQNTTFLNYPGMAATDMLFITHKFGGAAIVGGCGVIWNGNAWLIINENNAVNMPIGETFNVLIIKQ